MINSGTVKVLNSGLGPFKDQSAEMVLFLYFFYTKVLFFPIMIIMLRINKYLGEGSLELCQMYNIQQSYHNEHTHFLSRNV